MEDNSSRLVPYLCSLLARYPSDPSDSTAQLLLRVTQETPLLLTDGFYTVEGLWLGEQLSLNLFIKALAWNVQLGVNDLKLELKTLEQIGHEKMLAAGLPLVKQHPEVSRLLTPALRAQVAARLPPKTPEEVQVLLRLFDDHLS